LHLELAQSAFTNATVKHNETSDKWIAVAKRVVDGKTERAHQSLVKRRKICDSVFIEQGMYCVVRRQELFACGLGG